MYTAVQKFGISKIVYVFLKKCLLHTKVAFIWLNNTV